MNKGTLKNFYFDLQNWKFCKVENEINNEQGMGSIFKIPIDDSEDKKFDFGSQKYLYLKMDNFQILYFSYEYCHWRKLGWYVR